MKCVKGETLGIVGESGSGKSVTASFHYEAACIASFTDEKGEILFKGVDLANKTQKEMESIRGRDIGMIFQDPMSSLNPTIKVGKQISESLIKHQKVSKREGRSRRLP
ncbi:ATP-binding cassette domain-containing protein [Paenibacillus amylolyticus]|nr:ATP-binding cassette domain-containing protein [Paenibacillus amylolyticus]